MAFELEPLIYLNVSNGILMVNLNVFWLDA